MVNKKIKIEMAYAGFHEQYLLTLELEKICTIAEAIQLSGILTKFPEINLNKQKVGVFGKLRQLSDEIEDGQRLEIYRPLIIDPKERRRKKAK